MLCGVGIHQRRLLTGVTEADGVDQLVEMMESVSRRPGAASATMPRVTHKNATIPAVRLLVVRVCVNCYPCEGQ